MIESEIIVTTKHGKMPTFMAAPDRPDQSPGIIRGGQRPGRAVQCLSERFPLGLGQGRRGDTLSQATDECQSHGHVALKHGLDAVNLGSRDATVTVEAF